MKRLLTAFAAAVAMCLLCSGVALAATGKITKVGISLKDVDNNGPGHVYDCDVSTGYYTTVEDVTWSSSTDKPGQKITATVRIVPREEYRFITSGTPTKVEVDGGTLASKQLKTTELIAKVTYVTKMTLAPVDASSMYIDEDGTTLHWDGVENCKAYLIELSGGTSKNIRVWDQTYCDLGKYVTSDIEDTKIRIRAIPKTEAQEKYLFQSAWTSFDEVVWPSEDNTTTGVWEGSMPHLRFCVSEDDDTEVRFYSIRWEYIGGKWYYFDPEGHHYVKTGWLLDGGKWYYLDPQTAQMVTGWQQIPDSSGTKFWYFFAREGHMLTGWQQDAPGGKWYYLDPQTGKMWANATTPDGFRVDASGAWIQ